MNAATALPVDLAGVGAILQQSAEGFTDYA